MRRRFLLSVLLACGLAATLPAQADRVGEFVRAEMKRQNIPGLALVVIKDGQIVKAAGYGVADRSSNLPVTPDTVFKIGSVSKQFIATGIMLLVQDGRLRVDDPIVKYLAGAPPAWSAITIRQVLAHTAGLVREAPGFDPLKVQSDASVIASAYSRDLLSPPGEKWAYSNLGYFVLAEIIRVVSGQPWSDYIAANVFKPAGMAATRTTTTERVANMAKGYTDNERLRDADDWLAMRPSGAFLSTVMDLAKWEALLSTDTILRGATREAMWTPVQLNNGSSAPYGFGWHIESFNGRKIIYHGGGLPGFSSMYRREPDDRLTIVVLMNSDDTDPGALVSGVRGALQ